MMQTQPLMYSRPTLAFWLLLAITALVIVTADT